MTLRAALAAIVVAMATSPSGAFTGLGSTVEEVAERQSVGIESSLSFHGAPPEPRGHTAAMHAVLGIYGSDGILAGVGLSWHTTRLLPWDVGASAVLIDADIRTWTFAVSSAYPVWNNDAWSVVLEGAVGYQYLSESFGEDTSIFLDDPRSPSVLGDEILIDNFDFVHVVARAVITADVWFLHPTLDVAWVGTRWDLEGTVWDGSLPVYPAESRSRDGFEGKATAGAGVRIDIADRAALSGGIRLVGDAAVFQAGAGVHF